MSNPEEAKERAVLCRLLRDARHTARLSQVELGNRLGKRQSYVSDIERGVRRLDIVELRAYCAAVGAPLAEFVGRFEREASSIAKRQSK